MFKKSPNNAQLGLIIEGFNRLRVGMGHGIGAVLTATLCASLATAPFMAANFHEISPYVAIGNPLTMLMIEFIAVPGALLGTALYPLGLDGPVWHGVGYGINLVLMIAGIIAKTPGASLHVPAFAPWAIGFFALGISCFLLWRSLPWRLLGIPLLIFGFIGALSGTKADILLAPSGDMIGFRDQNGQMQFLSKKLNNFVLEQWLRADGDERPIGEILNDRQWSRCDDSACIVKLPNGQILSLISKPAAFDEDCLRADIVVTSLWAPDYCKPKLLFDKAAFGQMGAVGLTAANEGWIIDRQINVDDDRPWRVSEANSRRNQNRRFISKNMAPDHSEASPLAWPESAPIN